MSDIIIGYLKELDIVIDNFELILTESRLKCDFLFEDNRISVLKVVNDINNLSEELESIITNENNILNLLLVSKILLDVITLTPRCSNGNSIYYNKIVGIIFNIFKSIYLDSFLVDTKGKVSSYIASYALTLHIECYKIIVESK